MVALWDDHEVRDNWYPTEVLAEADRHAVKSVATLAARGRARPSSSTSRSASPPSEPRRIYRSIPYGPSVEIFALDMRTYRGANSPNRQPERSPATALLGDGAARLAQVRAASPRAPPGR